MPITQSVNSKANVKRPTTNDIPFSSAQPVINSFYATSTAGQTVINFGFTVQTTGLFANTDAFWLFVDGKKLDLGSSNDYVFSSVASDGTSSQVTLNFTNLQANLNIQAFKLGLKPEVQFGMDNRFVQAYAAANSGFQNFISQVDAVITPTTTVGAPVAGTFYSTITNRATIPDLSQDLKPRFGVDRLMITGTQLLQNEFGPNQEPISGVAGGDTFGQIRFGGNWQSFGITGAGAGGFQSNANGAGVYVPYPTLAEFMEVTFYGTGLNVLTYVNGSARTWSVQVDGGTATTVTPSTTSTSTINASQNFNMNVPVNVASGLTLGIHTVKITFTAGEADIYGVEMLTESASGIITVTPGIGYYQNKQYVNSAASTFAYSSVVTGTRGGRVLVYQTGTGTVGQAWTPVNTAQANLTAASHTNEEVARVLFYREFSAGRFTNADDWSTLTTTSGNRHFVIDDNATALVGNTMGQGYQDGYDGFGHNAAAAYFTFTFIGTGLDMHVFRSSTIGTDAYQIFVDGTDITAGGIAANTLFGTGTNPDANIKIVSGLPYGTHTVRVTRVAATAAGVFFDKLIVYQPKKPALPSGAIELADYNVLANFVARSAAGALTVAPGVIRKSSLREMNISGSGWVITSDTNSNSGAYLSSSASTTNFIETTFFGTGFEARLEANANAATYTFSVDGSTNLSAYTTSQVGTGNSFVAATGVYTAVASGGNTAGNGATVSGLPLGVHKVRITWTSGTGSLNIEGFDIITPIHSYKYNASVLQEFIQVGNQGISDNRKTTPVKDIANQVKAYAQATPASGNANVTTTSTTPVPLADMSVMVKTNGGALRIGFSVGCSNSGTAAVRFQVYVDGQPYGTQAAQSTSSFLGLSLYEVVPVSPGVHNVQIYWYVDSGTGNAGGDNGRRMLTVEER